MSLWLVVISLFVGVMASAFVPLPLALVLGLLLLSLVVLGICYFFEIKFEAVFLVCCAMVGWCNLSLHQHFLDESLILPFHKQYQASAPPSRNVKYLEDLFVHSSLSMEHRAELDAMMFGDRTQLSKDRRSMFRLAGAQHLLALSGTHLGILIAICYFLFLRRVRYSQFYYPVLIGVLAFLWFYTFMVGAPNSLRRAMLMATLFLLAKAGYRSTSGGEILASTIFLMLLFDPLCVFDVGAELSVAAVVGIVFLYPQFNSVIPIFSAGEQRAWNPLYRMAYRWTMWIWSMFCVSLSAWMLTMPLVLYYFGQIQPWQILTGVVLVPMTMFVLYIAFFVLAICVIGWLPLVVFCSTVLDRMMDLHDWLLVRCGELPYAFVRTTPISVMQMVVLYGIMMNVWFAWTLRTSRSIYLFSFYIILLLALLLI